MFIRIDGFLAELLNDPVLYGECLSGALYWNDFENLAKKAGFGDPRLVEDEPITIENEKFKEQIGHVGFYSATYRLFKLKDLEPACEDYGQAVVYNGEIESHENVFSLDKHHRIEKGRFFPVCGNTYRMLDESRFAPFFSFHGNRETHFGIFGGCGSVLPFDGIAEKNTGQNGGGCC